MAFKAKLVGHLSVAIAVIPVHGLVAIGPCEQCPQAQQSDLVNEINQDNRVMYELKMDTIEKFCEDLHD